MSEEETSYQVKSKPTTLKDIGANIIENMDDEDKVHVASTDEEQLI